MTGIRVRQGDRIRHRWPDGTRQWFTVGNITQHPAGAVAHCDGLTITLDPGGTLPADDIETVPEQIDRFLSGELPDSVHEQIDRLRADPEEPTS